MTDEAEQMKNLHIESIERGINPTLVLITESGHDTRSLGRMLGSLIRRATFIGLTGPLGSGKTCFAQGVADGLGVRSRVRSPSYILVAEHAGVLPFYHIDLYRIDDAHEVADLGWDEYLGVDAVVVVEWPEKAGGLVPASKIDVDISHLAPLERRLTISATGTQEGRLVGDLAGLLWESARGAGEAEPLDRGTSG